MAHLSIVLSATATALLVGGVFFAFANAGARGAGAADRFRLLGQAANPFVAFLAVAALLVLSVAPGRPGLAQRAAKPALALGALVCVAITLLAVNGILTDFVGDVSGLFRLSAVISRLGTIALGGYGLWLATAVTPPRQPPAPR